ncbi:hypothetical protein [Haloferula sp. A504]|uniref:hypothetical protein n=1 Tax=Haloferula sp. A504 TaxID=3373601 RepID=UPI0031C5BDAB|nr:hypothetical protein [Verrucomicrobiaceae bacterium E54]
MWALPEGMNADGVIAFPHTRERIDFLLESKCPVVCVGPHFSEVELPQVDWDDELTGQMAVVRAVLLKLRAWVSSPVVGVKLTVARTVPGSGPGAAVPSKSEASEYSVKVCGDEEVLFSASGAPVTKKVRVVAPAAAD